MDAPKTPELTLDLRGLKCPQPVLRARRALAAAAPGDRVTVLCTDPMAAIDIPHLVRETGDILVGTEREGGVLTFRLQRSPGGTAG